jgi:peroxiredoxin Q/BCP
LPTASYAAFTKAGASAVGISSDSPESHKAFKAKQNLPFQLLTDEGGDTAYSIGHTAYGI